MALTPVPIIDPGLGDVPDPADDEAVFEADAYDFTSRMPGFGSDIKAIGDATYLNAQWAETKAGEAATSASNANDSADAAADSATLALNWATSLTEVSSGLFGAKYYAQQAEAAVSVLPAGSINDAVIAADKAWSSTKVSAELGGKVSKTGDTMAGKLGGTVVSMSNFLDKTVTNTTAAGTVTLDFAQGDVFDLTLTGIAAVALTGIPALSSETLGFVVRVTQGATAYGLTWFSGITWLTTGGTAPDAPAANKTIEYIFTTKNGSAFEGRKGAAT